MFFGNGLVAIIAGLFGNLLVHSFSLGPVAPFDAAACFLAIGMAVILSSWSENYGDPSDNKDLITQFRGAAIAIASGELIVLLLLTNIYWHLPLESWRMFVSFIRWKDCTFGCHPVALWRIYVYFCIPLDSCSKPQRWGDSPWFHFCYVYARFDARQFSCFSSIVSLISQSRELHADSLPSFCCLTIASNYNGCKFLNILSVTSYLPVVLFCDSLFATGCVI